MRKTKLKIISEADMYFPFEKGMRGRVPTCLKDIMIFKVYISSVGIVKEKGDSDGKVLYKLMNNVAYG